MQYVKNLLVAGCLLAAATANAQWEIPTGNGGADIVPQYIDPPIQPPRREEPRRDRWRDFVEEESEASRLYYQTKPWREYNEMRNACDAIQGNDAARADCFQGLGGW